MGKINFHVSLTISISRNARQENDKTRLTKSYILIRLY